MADSTLFQLFKVVAVVVLVCIAAAIATPKNRIPIALRGIFRALHTTASDAKNDKVPIRRRILSFILILTAFLISIW